MKHNYINKYYVSILYNYVYMIIPSSKINTKKNKKNENNSNNKTKINKKQMEYGEKKYIKP